MGRDHILGAEIVGDRFGLATCSAVYNSPAVGLRRQVRGQKLVDKVEFFAAGRWHDREFQVGALSAAVKDAEINTELVTEVGADVFPHIGFGCGRQADYLPSGCLLADKAGHVAVVGPEVVAPAGQTVRLVQHPGADLALVQDPAHGSAAQLLG